MEEYAIARSHPIGTILKLKLNGVRNPTAYNGILLRYRTNELVDCLSSEQNMVATYIQFGRVQHGVEASAPLFQQR
jgi:hypothetical protein